MQAPLVVARADSTPQLLLALVDDGQRVIFELLSDALRPAVLFKLSACCRELRTNSEPVRMEVLRRHCAARKLCNRVRMSCAAVCEATELLWYGQGLTASHLATLGMLLSTNALPLLEVLNLSINRFGAEGMQAMLWELGDASLPRLRSLDLTGNVLGPVGVTALAATLRCGALTKIEVLKLGRNDIGDDGLVALAPPLRRLSALKELHLFSNQIGDEGVEALLGNLGQKELKQLQMLNLRNNPINDTSCATLLAALDGRPLLPLEPLGAYEDKRICQAAEARCKCLLRWGRDLPRLCTAQLKCLQDEPAEEAAHVLEAALLLD